MNDQKLYDKSIKEKGKMRSRYIQNYIIGILIDSEIHTAKEISDKLNIGLSTVYRHVRDLSLEFDIEINKSGQFKGIKLNRNVFVTKYFTIKEIKVLITLVKESECKEKSELIKKLSTLIS